MATFLWTGRTRKGARRKGELMAHNRDEAISILRNQEIFVASIRPKVGEIKFSFLEFRSRVKEKDLAVMTRQLATMIDAGLPLVQCLEILSHQTGSQVLAQSISDIRTDVEAGSSFADALKRHPRIFDELYVNMVAAGEAGGVLDAILNRLARYIEKNHKLRRKITSAMYYPVTIVSVAILVISVLMIWVIPTFATMFSDFGEVLPLPTRMVIQSSNFMQSYSVYLVLAAVAAGVFIRAYYRTARGRRWLDAVALRLPVCGELIRKASVAKFTRTLGTLVSSGVPILEGLTIVSRTAGNRVIEEAILFARQGISEGKTIAAPLRKANVFPPMVVQMISVGETAGALDTMLAKIADFYEEEVDAAVATMTSLVEPALMIFLGVAIGFIVIAMYLPIFEAGSLFG